MGKHALVKIYDEERAAYETKIALASDIDEELERIFDEWDVKWDDEKFFSGEHDCWEMTFAGIKRLHAVDGALGPPRPPLYIETCDTLVKAAVEVVLPPRIDSMPEFVKMTKREIKNWLVTRHFAYPVPADTSLHTLVCDAITGDRFKKISKLDLIGIAEDLWGFIHDSRV